MKKLLLLLTVMVTLSSTAMAQKYHDAAADQIVGTPKKVTMNDNGTVQTFTYDTDGKVSKKGMTNAVRNSQGYLTSYETSVNGVLGKYTMSYNTKGQLVKMVAELGGTPITNYFTYNADGTVKEQMQSVKIPMLNMTSKSTLKWTYNSIDDHGNWTSRTGKVMGKKTTQTRTIIYW